jgi:inositol-hexakisphosphate kinase
MQIFHEEEQKYTLWDKHWGRALQDQDIKPALETVTYSKNYKSYLHASKILSLNQYLSNGTSIRWDALKALQKKVEELELVVCRTPCEILFASSFLDHDEIRNTKGLRFWGSSLLLIYEGDFNRGTPREDVHLIDFAHCQQNEAIDSADEGLLLGLSNISKFLNSILACKQQGSSGSTSNF